MTTPVNPRALNIEAIRSSIPIICPDFYNLMKDYNETAQLDSCLIDTVETLYRKFFFKSTKDFSRAFTHFKEEECSSYLLKKIEGLQSNAERLAKTVNDVSGEDQKTYVSLAERIQDLIFVTRFVSSQHISLENHTCLTSVKQLELELKALQEKALQETGDHHLSLARIAIIQNELSALQTAFEKNQFDRMAQVATDLDRDLLLPS